MEVTWEQCPIKIDLLGVGDVGERQPDEGVDDGRVPGGQPRQSQRPPQPLRARAVDQPRRVQGPWPHPGQRGAELRRVQDPRAGRGAHQRP